MRRRKTSSASSSTLLWTGRGASRHLKGCSKPVNQASWRAIDGRPSPPTAGCTQPSERWASGHGRAAASRRLRSLRRPPLASLSVRPPRSAVMRASHRRAAGPDCRGATLDPRHAGIELGRSCSRPRRTVTCRDHCYTATTRMRQGYVRDTCKNQSQEHC